GTVVDRFDAHALGKARRDLRQPVLHVLDDRERILAETLERDAGDHLPFAVHLGDAAPFVGRKLDARNVLEQHRHAGVVLHHDLLEILRRLDIAATADCEFGLRDFDRATADIHVARADDIANARQRNAEGLKPARIDHDTVLLDEPPDAGHLRHAFGFGKPEADIPVLDGAELGEILLRAAHDILIDPTDAGCVRSEGRRDAGGQPFRSGAQIFENARARPIYVSAVLE